MLQKILKGKNGAAIQRLQKLWDCLGETPMLIWYPSSGVDFRDVAEFYKFGVSISTTLFIHTDYSINSRILKPKSTISITAEGAIIDNGLIQEALKQPIYQLIIENIYPLYLADDSIRYEVNPLYAENPHLADKNPTIQLLDISFVINDIKETASVLYFGFENINFLEQVLIRHSISIDCLVKVREGCGFGGNKKSITLAYGMLSALGTTTLCVDDEGKVDMPLLYELASRNRLTLNACTITEIKSLMPLWSGMHVRLFSVSLTDKPISPEDIQSILQQTNKLSPEAYM